MSRRTAIYAYKLCARWNRLPVVRRRPNPSACCCVPALSRRRKAVLGKVVSFRLGLGGPVGNGRQYLARIHIDDMVNGILWLLDNDLRGPLI